MFNLVPFSKNSMMKRGDYFDKILDTFFDDSLFAPVNICEKPFKVDVKETKDNYLIEAALPGIEKNDINIDYQNNYLTISAKKENKVEDSNSNYVRREISFGEFKRSFYVDNIDENNVSAEFTNGILKVDLPKLEKSKDNHKQIEIK